MAHGPWPALAAARHLELLGAAGAAWACRIVRRFGSVHSRLMCAYLEASAWEGHRHDLSLAMAQLRAGPHPCTASESRRWYRTVATRKHPALRHGPGEVPPVPSALPSARLEVG